MSEPESTTTSPQDAAPTQIVGDALEQEVVTSDAALAQEGAAPAAPVPPEPAPAVAPAKRKRKKERGKWAARVVLALLFLLGFFLSVVPAGRAVLRGAVILPSLLSASQSPLLQVAGESIAHTQQQITASTGPVYLDIYAPTSAPPPIPGSREAVVIIPGIGDNRTDPQLINLSESLARAGIVVVDLTTPDLIAFNILPSESDAVVKTFQYTAHLPGVNPNSIGIVGFSGGSVLACLAAADPRIQHQVAFITLFGTLFDAAQLLRDFGRRSVTADGEVIPFHPYADPIIVMSQLVGNTLPPDEAQLFINGLAPGGTPLSNPDAELTTPGAAAAYHLIAGDEPDRVDQNMAALSPAVRTLLKQLSPSQFYTQIRCPIYLLHDHNDPAVPFTESRDFDAALTAIGHPHEYEEFGIFHHTEITSGFGLGPLLTDGSKLYRILTGVLLPGA